MWNLRWRRHRLEKVSVDHHRRSRYSATVYKYSGLLFTEHRVKVIRVFCAAFVFIILRLVWSDRMKSFHRTKTVYFRVYHLLKHRCLGILACSQPLLVSVQNVLQRLMNSKGVLPEWCWSWRRACECASSLDNRFVCIKSNLGSNLSGSTEIGRTFRMWSRLCQTSTSFFGGKVIWRNTDPATRVSWT